MTAYNWRIIQKKQIIEDELNKSSWLQMNQGGYRHETIRDQDLCKSDLELYFLKSFNADNFHFYADWRISNNIGHFVTFEKSKTTCPFIEYEASMLSYLTGLLTTLPGEHIPLLWSSCLVSKPLAETFVIVVAWLNPATADPFRRCLSSPLCFR